MPVAPPPLRRWRRLAYLLVRALERCETALASFVHLRARPFTRILASRVVGAIFAELASELATAVRVQPLVRNPEDVEARQVRCPHPAAAMKRYGNQTGRYALCQECQRKWRYNVYGSRWEVVQRPAGPSSAASSSRLPLPSSADTTVAVPWVRPRSKNTARAKQQASGMSSESRRPSTSGPLVNSAAPQPEEYDMREDMDDGDYWTFFQEGHAEEAYEEDGDLL